MQEDNMSRVMSDSFRMMNEARITSEGRGYINQSVEQDIIKNRRKLGKFVSGMLGCLMVLTGVAQGGNYLSHHQGSLSESTNIEQAVNAIGNQNMHRTANGMKMDVINSSQFAYENINNDFKSGDSKVVYNRSNPEEFMLINRNGDNLDVHISQAVLESPDNAKMSSMVEEATRYAFHNHLNVRLPRSLAEHNTSIKYIRKADGNIIPMTANQLSYLNDNFMPDICTQQEISSDAAKLFTPDNNSNDIRFTPRPDDSVKPYQNMDNFPEKYHSNGIGTKDLTHMWHVFSY